MQRIQEHERKVIALLKLSAFALLLAMTILLAGAVGENARGVIAEYSDSATPQQAELCYSACTFHRPVTP